MNNRIVNSDKSKLPIIGKIRIGIKKVSQNGKEYPAAVDYFVPTGPFASYFTSQFGDKANKIKIIFPNSDSVVQKYELRDKQLYAESDGLTLKFAKDKSWHEVTFESTEKCLSEMANMQSELNIKGLEWHKKLSMSFIIPELNGVFGIWQFETKAAASMVDQITNMIDSCEQIYGQINFVPFWFTVEMKTHRVFDENRKFPVVSITPMINPFQFQALSSVNDVLKLFAPEQKAIAEKNNEESELINQINNCKTKIELSELAKKNKALIEKYNLVDTIKDLYSTLT